jgi:hypothetical protein
MLSINFNKNNNKMFDFGTVRFEFGTVRAQENQCISLYFLSFALILK